MRERAPSLLVRLRVRVRVRVSVSVRVKVRVNPHPNQVGLGLTLTLTRCQAIGAAALRALLPAASRLRSVGLRGLALEGVLEALGGKGD